MSTKATIRRALISVYDKTGVAEFARTLHSEFGTGILSTGGTADAIEAAGVPVTRVETLTGFDQLLDGRVKTLHPKVFAAILADRDNPDHMRQLEQAGIEPVDLVVVGLYPFEQVAGRPDCTFEQAIEMIDIGGVALLRAAAKNCKHVWAFAITKPEDYMRILDELRGLPRRNPEQARRIYAGLVFHWVANYNLSIGSYLYRGASEAFEEEPSEYVADAGRSVELPLLEVATLRYGENPHQDATLYEQRDESDKSLMNWCLPDEWSYNNVLDADAALRLCSELSHAFPQHAVCCFIKHTNPCGVGLVSLDVPGGQAAAQLEAYRRAYLGDPNAAMGGILAVNFPVTADFADAVMDTYRSWGRPLREAGAPHAPGGFFIEVWIAPEFDDDAMDVIAGEKPNAPRKAWGRRVRIVHAGDPLPRPDESWLEYRSVLGGMLAQTPDVVGLDEDRWQVVSKRPPSEAEWRDLKLAWLICKHTKSNAITICRDGMLIGNGAGQTSRVMSCRIATWQARANGHAEALAGAAAASDAFFPFRDGPDVLLEAGVRAIIQPGGSKRDAETIAACDERDAALVLTGTRHFRH